MARIPPRSVVFPALAIMAQCLLGTSAFGQDVAPPSQALTSDPAPPVPRLSVTVDPLGMAFGEWGARIELAPIPAHSVFLEGGYRSSALSPGVALEVGYHLFFLGDGLDGPFVGPSVAVAVTTARGDAGLADQTHADVSLFGALEAGWHLALGPIALGLAAGIEAHVAFASEAMVVMAPRISILVGYVLR